MTWAKSRWLAGGLSLLLMAGSAAAQTDKSKEKSKEKSKSSAPRSTLPGPPHRQTNSVSSYGSGKKQATQTNDSRSRPGEGSKRATDDSTKAGDKTAHTTDRDKPIDNRSTAAPARKLETKPLPDGHIKVTASGQVREKMEKKLDGEHTQYLAPTGKVQREVVQKSDGTQNTIHYAPNGKVQRTVEVSKDGVKQTSYVHYDRDGKERATETVKVDDRGKEVSKTVVVRQTTVIVKNTTVVKNTTIVRNYDRARYGFVYHPVYVVNSPVFVSWYDPYWYSPSGVLIVHPFRY